MTTSKPTCKYLRNNNAQVKTKNYFKLQHVKLLNQCKINVPTLTREKYSEVPNKFT